MPIGEEWIDPVTDRTQYDVDRARSYINSMKGRYETLEGMKGCLNISDLNRIEGNIKYLSDILSLSLTSKEWTISEIPTSSDESRIIGNTSSLLSAISLENPPTIPDNLYSYSDFNEIEDILLTIYENIPPYDETKIAVVLLDENDEPTDEIEYFDTLEDSATYLKNHSSNRYLVHIGKDAGITTLFNRSFSQCASLVMVDIPEDVTSIGMNCFSSTSLIDVNIPNSVETISANAFQGCTSLVNANIYGGSGIQENCFYGCTALTDVTLPDTVTAISTRAFYNCTSLRHIELPSSMTTIQDYAFQSCLNITFIIHKPQNSISGSPWGATNALVIWTG